MVCITYTAPVPPPPATPVVSALEVLGKSGTTALSIRWYQNVAGTVSIFVDSQYVKNVSVSGAGYGQTIVNVGDNSQNHQICVE